MIDMNETKPDYPWDDLPAKNTYTAPPSNRGRVAETCPPDEIDFACGHTSLRPINMLETSAAWMAENGICRDCWKAQQRNAADHFAADNDLPALRGTEKQIAWATSLRHEAIIDLQGRIFLAEVRGHAAIIKKHTKTLEGVREITSAAAWIEAREFSPEALLAMVQSRLRPRKRTTR